MDVDFVLGVFISLFKPVKSFGDDVVFFSLNKFFTPDKRGVFCLEPGVEIRRPADLGVGPRELVNGDTIISPGPLGVSGMSEYRESEMLLAEPGVLGVLGSGVWNKSATPDRLTLPPDTLRCCWNRSNK